MAVATVNSLDGKSIDDYALCLLKKWHIGRAGGGDGVVILLAAGEQEVRIETGDALTKLITDDETERIVKEKMLPPFKQGQFARGLELGAAAVMRETGGE